ncbi:I78 family peptidase inhibitor [Ensifer sp. 4252]|uniref:I78 family peptidase inhibitor n=1 Tax=Ensifer sp. 4252 TaxID=3373915 RepID=UPI003D240A2E
MPLIYARQFAALAASLLLLAAAGCQKEPESTAPQAAGPCKPEVAETLPGKDRISDEDAKRITGATIVRQLKPGDPATMDFRQERVTIETDPATGKIVRAMCG